MYAAELASTGALETSTLHQLSTGNNAPGGDPGNAPPSTGCPTAPGAASSMPAITSAAATVQTRRVVRKLVLTRSFGVERRSVQLERAVTSGSRLPAKSRAFVSSARSTPRFTQPKATFGGVDL